MSTLVVKLMSLLGRHGIEWCVEHVSNRSLVYILYTSVQMPIYLNVLCGYKYGKPAAVERSFKFVSFVHECHMCIVPCFASIQRPYLQ